MPFPYKTVLITGATSGIGLALAERMISHGIFVIAVGRRTERLNTLVAKYGTDKVAAEPYDVSDLAGMTAWVKHITSTYPTLTCIVLNAGEQNKTIFTPLLTTPNPPSPTPVLETITRETTLNYLSPVHLTAHFIPHLSSLSPLPTAIILVSSGLALVPYTGCANYSATKAALHSFAWTLRSQLSSSASSSSSAGTTSPPRVIEIIPPAVQTELHTRQGLKAMGMPLAEFTDETWAALTAEGEEARDEILVGPIKDRFTQLENGRRAAFAEFEKMMKSVGQKA